MGRLLPAVGAAVACGIAAMAWTALLLAELGIFSFLPPLLALVAVPAALAPILVRRMAGGEGDRRRRFTDPAAVVVALATLLLSLPASEFLLGGWDPGVYVHIAAAVARGRSLTIEAPDLAALTQEEQRLFTRYRDPVEPFAGMRMLPDGRLSPQFYHLYPSLMAVLHSLGGPEGSWLVNPLLNVASVLALYALASPMLGPWWGLLAALCLAANPGQVWQAKFSTSELLTQFLLLAGAALAAWSFRRERATLEAALAGALLGCAMLARYDSLAFFAVLLPLLVVGAAAGWARNRVAWLLAGFAPLAVHAWIHQSVLAPFYAPLGRQAAAVLAAVGAALVLMLAAARTRVWAAAVAAVRRADRRLRIAAALLVAGWTVFGWAVRPGLGGKGAAARLLRPILDTPATSGVWRFLTGIAAGDMLIPVDLLGPAGFALAVAGIIGLILTSRGWWSVCWLAASIAIYLVFTGNAMLFTHVLMWSARRHVPVVLPLLAVGTAAAGSLAAEKLGRIGPALGTAAVAAVLLLQAPSTGFIGANREWPGLLDWYRGIDRAIPADAAVYSDQPGFAAPLRFVFGRKAYEIPRRDPALWPARLGLMRRRAALGGEVCFLSTERIADPAGQGLRAVGEFPLGSAHFAQQPRGVPRQMKDRGGDFVLYRVLPP